MFLLYSGKVSLIPEDINDLFLFVHMFGNIFSFCNLCFFQVAFLFFFFLVVDFLIFLFFQFIFAWVSIIFMLDTFLRYVIISLI